MHKFILAIVSLAISIMPLTASNPLKDILNKASEKAGGVTDIVSDIVGGGEVKVKDLVGAWKYASPAVTFKSDNLLKKAGGAAAASTVENKIAPYYKQIGITSLTLKVEEDSTFTMNVKKVALKGNITRDKDGQYKFNFKAFKKVKIGAMPAYLNKSGKNIKLTFDVSNLISLVEKISAVSGNAQVKTVSSILSSYDGLNAGFELSPTADKTDE